MLVLDTIGATIYGRAIGDVQDVPVRRIPCDRWKILVIIAFLSASVFGHCQAEEHLFLNDNPRYPLIFAIDRNRRYLDLDSCAIISNDENGFEISAQCICQDMESNEPEKNQTFRFRKNAESNWKLQVWEEFWARYSSEWRTIPDPMELKDIEQTLDTKGYINYHFPAYYLFKCVYQQLFNEPYKDNIDDEVLRRSAIIPQDRDTSKIDPYLWGDKNYPCVWMYQGWAWNLDKSSVYVEMEASSQYILRILVLETPFLQDDDILARHIHSYRLLYDKNEGKMYKWDHMQENWLYISPDSNDSSLSDGIKYVGEATFYLVYGEKFYNVSSYKLYERLAGNV